MQENDALIGVYNAKGEIIGQKSRKEIDKKKDILKTANIILFNHSNDIFMIKAADSLWKDKWGGSCAGLVRKNESVEEAATRTLQRELGIKVKINLIGEEYCDFGDAKRIFAVFVGRVSEDQLSPNKEDFKEWSWNSFRKAHEMSQKDECMPTFKKALEMMNIKI